MAGHGRPYAESFLEEASCFDKSHGLDVYR